MRIYSTESVEEPENSRVKRLPGGRLPGGHAALVLVRPGFFDGAGNEIHPAKNRRQMADYAGANRPDAFLKEGVVVCAQ